MINTILVTDDNVLDNAILRNYLYNERVNLVSALNGMEALELVESRNVDLILLDLVMPVLDGFGFLKQFSKTELYKEIPIIVASSLDDAKNIEEILQYNIFDYVIKPLDHTNRLILVNKIKKAIEFRKTIADLKKATKIINKVTTSATE
ncbi:MAG: response regulator [Clostridia bacterium]|nr:response regulator [Clostridia bacterium]